LIRFFIAKFFNNRGKNNSCKQVPKTTKASLTKDGPALMQLNSNDILGYASKKILGEVVQGKVQSSKGKRLK
jgi:hypothetical protein